jgi:aminoglycoside/choline kinase family phosphotransferase
MNKADSLKAVTTLFKNWKGQDPDIVQPLPPSGSYREYFRLWKGNRSYIGAWNADLKENAAFIYFSGHFLAKKLPVPEVYEISADGMSYLLEDLGDMTLLSYYQQVHQEVVTDEIKQLYREILRQLVRFQFKGIEGLDLSYCYPRSRFDLQSIAWDLNYFKYYFLKFAKVGFDEQLLESDFAQLAGYLLQAGSDSFLYRDFQSRNIMITPGGPYFIDYQGGRAGAAQYDPVSLLFEPKTHIPEDTRMELLDGYISEYTSVTGRKAAGFMQYYYAFALIRQLQAMGSYGFRGIHENKPLFLESIPYALENVKNIQSKLPSDLNIPTLRKALLDVADHSWFNTIGRKHDKLTLRINSFSFKGGLPFDTSLNGGGFVFDCRGLPNPGRDEQLKVYTGLDPQIREFFSKHEVVDTFISHAWDLVNMHLTDYKSRGFHEVMVSFGCTGGRHRSVYCAEKLAERIAESWPAVQVITKHTNLKLG